LRRPLAFPWLNDFEIREKAERFLAAHYPQGRVPIPIELIVEKAGVDIVPVPGLRDRYEVEAVTNVGGHTIWVDQGLSEERETRYRFTLAHEMGHIELHSPVFQSLLKSNLSFERCADVLLNLPDDVRRRIEFQARVFAGIVLVPKGPLLQHYSKTLPSCEALHRKATRMGLTSSSAAKEAWDDLCVKISGVFNVSSEVVRRRLEFEGRAPTVFTDG
jgi:hypothetical protein